MNSRSENFAVIGMTLKLGNLLRKFSVDAVKNEALPFEMIPGPRGFLGIGNFYNYFKFFGKYSFDELHRSGLMKYEKYGTIVCERMVPGVSVVWLFEPNDIAQLFNESPGNFPRRRSHLALEKYRKDRPEIYRSGGLLPTNGDEWWRIRSELQKGLSKPQNVRNFLPEADTTIKEFMKTLPQQFDENQEVDEMLNELSRLNLELTCLLAFDERLDSFSDEERRAGSRSSRLMQEAENTNVLVLPLDQGFQWWRWFETPSYRKLRKAQEYLEQVSVELVSRKVNQLSDGNSLIDQYLRNPNLSVNDLYGIAADLLLAGVHTSSFSTAFALYHISNDQRVQDLIFAEALKVMPNEDDPLTPAMMNTEIPFTRAALKESLRLNPISVGVGRILNQDMIIGGYHIPKETVVVTQNQISCRLEKYFPNALKFSPERWLKTDDKKVDFHPHLLLPFGHGVRSCIARRFAEQNILIFLLRLLRSYKIEWRGTTEPLDLKTKLINQPSSKITLKFEKRKV